MDLLNAISFAEFSDGPAPCNWQAGQQIDLFGPDPARASRSVAQAKAKAPQTSGTCGQNSPGLSASARLQSSLASRLRQRLDVNGSPEYSLTWKEWDMPQREPICALRASARRTSDSGSGGALTGHATPKASDGQGGRTQPTAGGGNAHLDVQARGALDGYHTPVVRDLRNSGGDGTNQRDLPRQASQAMASGTHGNPSTSETEKRGALNPAFSAWLMGYPPEWCDCADMAMQSFPRLRRSSSVLPPHPDS